MSIRNTEASHSARYLAGLVSRRELFHRGAAGFAGLALASLLCEDEARGDTAREANHFTGKAKAVIQLFQHGGPSHVDLLDPNRS